MKFLLVALVLMSGAYAQSGYNVHEWGTFTSLVGSDGVRQTGMFHEDELLPSFVHNFGEKKSMPSLSLFGINALPLPRPRPGCGRNTKVGCGFLEGQDITQKMETPVLYFHSDVPRNVSVEVGFPGGIISQTYPAPVISFPAPIEGVKLKNGFNRFNVDVLTDSVATPVAVAPGNIYSYARQVKANTIKSGNEVEKFIFYRGLGKFDTQLLLTSKNGNITAENKSPKRIPAVFLVDNTDDGGAIASLGELNGNEQKFISEKSILALKSHHQNFSLFARNAKALLLKSLVANGLNKDEAQAMVNTWEHGYFKTKGLRILYVLNREEVESILPMKITPKPSKLNRVFVGRIEVLLDTEENEILAQIIKERESFDVLSLGRFAPSIIARIHELAEDRGLLDSSLESVFDGFSQIIAEKL